MAYGLKRGYVPALMLLAAAAAQGADPLPDPTRPPEGWTSSGAAAETGAETGRRLQTVILPRRGKPVAVIGGQRVSLGEKYGDAKVVKITEKEVVLQGPEGRETLKLITDAEKQTAATVKPDRMQRAEKK